MSFDVKRLRGSDQLIAGSAIALFVFVFFFDWYGARAGSSVGRINFNVGFTGWHTFTVSRWVWLVTIVVALGAVIVSAGALELSRPTRPAAAVTALGALSTLLILYRIFHHASGGTSGSVAGAHYSSSYGIRIGIWLGLLAAAILTCGGYLAMSREADAPVSEPRTPAAVATTATTALPVVTLAEAPAPPLPSIAAPPGESPFGA
jgi:hypothetical protein